MSQLLDLDGISQRSETIRFDILDNFNTPTGRTLDVSREDVPSVTVDTDRSIKRTLDGVTLLPSAVVDIFSERVRPVWVVDGEEYPLGVFLFAEDSDSIHTYGTLSECDLVDQALILDQDLSETVNYDQENITAALQEQANLAGIVSTNIENTSADVAQPTAWAAGRDTRLKVMEDLCELAGFLPPYFDNDGTLVCRSTPDFSTPDFTYGLDTVVIADSIYASSDLLRAPNRYLVIDTGSPDQEIAGIFDVPISLPFSIANRGFVVQKTIDMQGLESNAAAERAAQSAYLKDANTFGWLAFATTPKPDHDIFNTIAFDGDVYREQGWSLPLSAGSEMQHDCRKVIFDA